MLSAYLGIICFFIILAILSAGVGIFAFALLYTIVGGILRFFGGKKKER